MNFASGHSARRESPAMCCSLWLLAISNAGLPHLDVAGQLLQAGAANADFVVLSQVTNDGWRACAIGIKAWRLFQAS